MVIELFFSRGRRSAFASIQQKRRDLQQNSISNHRLWCGSILMSKLRTSVDLVLVWLCDSRVSVTNIITAPCPLPPPLTWPSPTADQQLGCPGASYTYTYTSSTDLSNIREYVGSLRVFSFSWTQNIGQAFQLFRTTRDAMISPDRTSAWFGFFNHQAYLISIQTRPTRLDSYIRQI